MMTSSRKEHQNTHTANSLRHIPSTINSTPTLSHSFSEALNHQCKTSLPRHQPGLYRQTMPFKNRIPHSYFASTSDYSPFQPILSTLRQEICHFSHTLHLFHAKYSPTSWSSPARYISDSFRWKLYLCVLITELSCTDYVHIVFTIFARVQYLNTKSPTHVATSTIHSKLDYRPHTVTLISETATNFK